jgi:hypothetical protein
MTRPSVLAALLATAAIPAAHAVSVSVYVASFGSDLNPCTFNSPCRTINGTSGLVANNATIFVLDSAEVGEGAMSVLNQSITLDGGSHGAVITGPSTNPALTFLVSAGGVLTLRNLAFQVGANGTAIQGTVPNGTVHLENITVSGDPASVGVLLSLGGGSKATLKDVVVTRAANCIQLTTTLTSDPPSTVNFDHVTVDGCGNGVFVQTSNLTIRHSSFNNNSQSGIQLNTVTAATTSLIENSEFGGNATAINGAGGPITVRLSNNVISNNTQGLGGPVTYVSFRNNAFSGNGADGTINLSTSLK